MHNFIKIISTSLLLILLCGCSKNSVKIYEKEYSGEGYEMLMEIPELQNDTDFANTFNTEYITFADDTLNSFIAEANATSAPNDTLTLKQEIKLDKNGIISIVGHCETVTGGPHPTAERIVKNIDLKNAKYLSFKDLFNDDAYIDRVNSYISTLLEINPEKFDELWKTPSVSENQDFYLTDNGIVIFYPPYELSYYSKGFVEIELPYKDFESYLNPEYLNLIWKK